MTETTRRTNPYDFIRDVRDGGLFAGRRDELVAITEEIERLTGDVPIAPVVSIVGERRVGKTSLLNQLENYCDKIGVLPIRVLLTSGMADDQWEFWRDIFQGIIAGALSRNIFSFEIKEKELGFVQSPDDQVASPIPKPPRIYFEQEYALQKGTANASSTMPPSTRVIERDLSNLCNAAYERGLHGIVLMIDEAQNLPGKTDLTQTIRHVLSNSNRFGVIFAGERKLNRIFTEPEEPFYLQARVVPLENYHDVKEVIECALQPLREAERSLMSPMTMDYLSQLSHGKPNQVRLICHSIYERYRRGDQDDLDININVLDDVLQVIESVYSQDYDVSQQVERIRRLSSVDLEALYHMTKYPNWRTSDVIDLAESFRGEARSNLADIRRANRIGAKRANFNEMGLMADAEEQSVLAANEFLYLYLRFWYEVRKFGDLSRKVELGKGPPTLFLEKAEKLLRSLSIELKKGPEIVSINVKRDDTGAENVISNVKKRYEFAERLKTGSDIDPETDFTDLAEYMSICELIGEPGTYRLVILSVRNLVNPRESVQVEAYFPGDQPLIIPISLLRTQAEHARVFIEDFDQFNVELPDFQGLLNSIGGIGLDAFLEQMDLAERWRIESIQRMVQEETNRRRPANEDEGLKDTKKSEEDQDWVILYDRGEPEKAEELLQEKLSKSPDRPKAAHFYNDRGYIRYGLNKPDSARSDLRKAIDFHFENLQLTLLNLGVMELDEQNYQQAMDVIEDALFLIMGRESIAASHLRLRIPKSNLPITSREKWEQNPANALEAAYINMAFAVLHEASAKEAINVLREGLQLLPSSIRLKHALARYHLAQHDAPKADLIYGELSQANVPYPVLSFEIKLYARTYLKRGRRKKGRAR